MVFSVPAGSVMPRQRLPHIGSSGNKTGESGKEGKKALQLNIDNVSGVETENLEKSLRKRRGQRSELMLVNFLL